METIQVKAERPYEIHIGRGILSSCARLLLQHARAEGGGERKVFVVTDRNVGVRCPYLHTLIETLEKEGLSVSQAVLRAGERTKSFKSLSRLIGMMTKEGLGRDDILIGLGGGVIGDLAGFAASVYMRGLSHVLLPTTLLAQVDSSIGGKTGINTREGKNLVGSFRSPLFVLIDIDTLSTLEDRQWLCGLAEIVKCGLVGDRELFETAQTLFFDTRDAPPVGGRECRLRLEKDQGALYSLISGAIRMKRSIVARDEKEQGVRRLLNFGHTFGHAIENLLGYGRLLHGEAVILGMRMATELSAALGLLPEKERVRIALFLARLSIPRPGRIKATRIFEQMQKDKKKKDGRVHYVLLAKTGEGTIRSDPDARTVVSCIEKVLDAL
ncbi:MAG: 3-dehydroquinate synthase [Spirochaetes bacterium]|nr:3-dehydroquinate synthase [Spirochaetota bacterium]